jgi:hypothetical protein
LEEAVGPVVALGFGQPVVAEEVVTEKNQKAIQM